MFTTPCFIRKNTPELLKKLENLGYRICPCVNFDNAKWLSTCLLTDYDPSVHGIGYEIEGTPYTNEKALDFFIEDNKNAKMPKIDCNENENLFLALTALRNDSDKNQWFTDGKIWECSNSELPGHYMQLNGHKATVEEIIEHFK